MENRNAQKLIEKIQKDIFKNKFEIESIIIDLKKIREYSLEEQNPVVTKALRLAYEHLESNKAFLIGIPEDELEEEEEEETESTIAVSKENDLESFDYFMSLLSDLTKKNNLLDLKEYNIAFIAN